jgi:hypothetical protein
VSDGPGLDVRFYNFHHPFFKAETARLRLGFEGGFLVWRKI